MSQRTKIGDERRVLVVGSDPVGAVVARNLSGNVEFLGVNERIARRVADDVCATEVIANTGQFSPPEGVDVAIVATAADSTNLLAAQRLRLASDADVVVRLNDPARRQAFADLEVKTVCVSTDVGESLTEQYARLVESTE